MSNEQIEINIRPYKWRKFGYPRKSREYGYLYRKARKAELAEANKK